MLREEGFTQGVHGQGPPKLLANLVPKYHGPEQVNLDTMAPCQVPPLLDRSGDDLHRPHLRVGSAAASSRLHASI